MSCGNPHETDCREVLARVYEFLDNELGEVDVEKIRQHLDECEPCLRQYKLDIALKALLRRSCACEQAPMMQVDDRYEGNLTPEKVDRILEGLR